MTFLYLCVIDRRRTKDGNLFTKGLDTVSIKMEFLAFLSLSQDFIVSIVSGWKSEKQDSQLIEIINSVVIN